MQKTNVFKIVCQRGKILQVQRFEMRIVIYDSQVALIVIGCSAYHNKGLDGNPD